MTFNKFLERFEKRLSSQIFWGRSLGELLVLTLIAIYVLIFSYYSILKHSAFASFGFDLGIYNQALYTALHGMFFYETPDLFWSPNGSFFGVHFAPLLYLILPIYAIRPEPETLLVLQSFILGIGALPIYWIARRELRSSALALLCAAMYLINPGIHAVNLYDFHLEAFLPAFFLFAYSFFLSESWLRYLSSVVLITITIDYANLILIFFGLYLFVEASGALSYSIRRIRSLFGMKTSGKHLIAEKLPSYISLVTVILGIVMFITAYTTTAKYGPTLTSLGNWPYLGKSLGEIIQSLFKPSRVIMALSVDWYSKLVYVILLLATMAFLPFLKLSSLIMTVPWFAISLFSSRGAFYELGWQYPANVIPFLLIGTIYGIKRLQEVDKFNRVLAHQLLIIVFISLVLSPLNPLTRGNIPNIPGWSYVYFATDKHTELLHQVINLIPTNSSILTQNDIFAHVSGRANAYLSVVPELPDYILFDNTLPGYGNSYGGKTTEQIIQSTMKLSKYGVLASGDGIFLLKRNYTGEALVLPPD